MSVGFSRWLGSWARRSHPLWWVRCLCGGVAGCVGVAAEWSAFFDVRYVMVSSTYGRSRRRISSVAAGVACVGLTVVSPLTIADVAYAATGQTDSGISILGFGPFPDPDATFATPGTAGTLMVNLLDQTGGEVTWSAGDSETWIVTLPAGLELTSSACSVWQWPNYPGAQIAKTCVPSADKRTITATAKLNQGTYVDGSGSAPTLGILPVVSTGPVYGGVQAIYKAPSGATVLSSANTTSILRPRDVPGAQLNTVSNVVISPPDANGTIRITGTGDPGASVRVQAAQINLTGTGPSVSMGNGA